MSDYFEDMGLNKRVALAAGWVQDCPYWRDPVGAMREIPNYTQSRDAIIGLVEGLDIWRRKEICELATENKSVFDIITTPARDICMAYVKVMEC